MSIQILSQMRDSQNLFSSFSSFFHEFKVGKLLHRCNATKQKGVSVTDIFKYTVENAFLIRSMYMQLKTGSFYQSFSKNTVYRFLSNPKINWLRFTTLLAKAVADVVEPLTNKDRVNAFVIDDSLFERTSHKHIELVSNVFDHNTKKYHYGFRFLVLGWTDGNTFLPINSTLQASTTQKSLFVESKKFDGRTLAARRRKMARTKATDVVLYLLKYAMHAGFKAKHVLFDSWFFSPKEALALKKMGLHTICRIKRTKKVCYEYNDKFLDIKQLYNQARKNGKESRYLCSIDVKMGREEQIPARIVCMADKHNKKTWIALLSTDMSLSPEEIIRIYGKRWGIETFFKTSKSYLQLVKGCHCLSYDALTAHTAMVLVRFMMLALTSRRNNDERSYGELFYMCNKEMEDITVAEVVLLIAQAYFKRICTTFSLSKDWLQKSVELFVHSLPLYLQRLMLPSRAV